jgi:hypothetical protein
MQCSTCGAPANISDRDGAYCRTHWDEQENARHAEEKHATEEAGGPWPQLCPRRVEDGTTDRFLSADRPRETPDVWEIREQMHKGLRARHCSYCGSLHPDDFMERVLAGWEVGPTDKNYKAYLRRADSGGPESKFYFQHLSVEQRHQFIDLLNAGTMHIGYPGHFYVHPFFVGKAYTHDT